MSEKTTYEEIKEFHEKILYPCTLVRTSKAGGSGTVIYSQPHPDGDGYLTHVLTNHHVVDDAITYATEFNSIVGRDVKRPILEQVTVGFYKYRHLSQQAKSEGSHASILHWDKTRDLALLELVDREKADYVATLFPEEGKHLYMDQEVRAVGCSLGHKPLPSDGIISSLDEQIENQPRFMSSACIIYGNSGGALYLRESGELVGIPCAGDVILSGFSAQAIPHLGYAIPFFVIYDTLREWCRDYIWGERTYEECEEARKGRMDSWQLALDERYKREQAHGK